uniref:LD29816p n=1 Tax=Drosophila melanogaster TaxID=7227 RepID=Q8SWW1_DROME|nr:LD29816p [Drosophila melanogaster]
MQELPTNKRFIVYTSSSCLVSVPVPSMCHSHHNSHVLPNKHCPPFLPDLYLQPYPHDPLLPLLLGGVQEVIRHMEHRLPRPRPKSSHLEHLYFLPFIRPHIYK